MKKTITTIFTAILSLGAVMAQDVIIPKPMITTYTQGSIKLAGKVTFNGTNSGQLEQYLAPELKNRFGITLTAAPAASAKLIITVDPRIELTSKEGWYLLTITPQRVEIRAKDNTGAFYGVQSLLQLLGSNNTLKGQTILDAPRFGWRSYLLDEARHFRGQEQVMMLLDAMAQLKMNIFHWHLTDDNGWRVESKKYPLLTQIGSKRTDTQIGGWNSPKRSGQPHEGYYTQEQIKEIVAYAKARHIKIVPEIEMPGHASAAIAAYPWLGSDGKKIEVPATFGKHYPILNVIEPRVEQFIQDVVAEMIELFQTDVIHIGGDEVRFNQWEENPVIARYKTDRGFQSFMDIQIEFTNKMSNYIAKRGATMMGWNEILGKNLHADDKISFSDPSQKVASNVIVQFWKGDLNDMAAAAAGGYRIVNSHHISTYLDYTYQDIPLRKAYDFEPIPQGLKPEFEENIIGSGCQMWSEWVTSHEKMQLQTFPRLAAYAEVGWTQRSEKNYDDFVQRLKPIVKAWQAKGISVTKVEEIQ